MEPICSAAQQLNGNDADASGQQVVRNNSRGIRVVGNRIYDSTNGKTCHQCRQKTRDFAASCKNVKNGKVCIIKFCYKCLRNRYGEIAQEVEKLNDWNCPKCRGICNCSCCMKRRGQKPTGALVHTAKASGFQSVSEMLGGKVSVTLPKETTSTMKEEQKCVEDLSSDKVPSGTAVSPVKLIASEKELVVDLSGKPEKENSVDGNLDGQKIPVKKSKKTKREGLTEISNGNNVDDARPNKKSKKAKLSNGVSDGETKKDKNHDIVLGQMDGPEAWAANDFFFDPKTLVSNGFPITFNPCGVKEMNLNNLNDTVAIGGGDNAGMVSQMGLAESLKAGKCVVNLVTEKVEEEISLPAGTEITGISDIELVPEDVGSALQFLEFCRVFGKVLDVKKGEGEAILRELIRKHNLRRGQNTLVVQFQIRLLNIILADSDPESQPLTTSSGKNSWLKALEDLITDSDLVLKEFPLDWIEEGIDGYYGLELSKKLSLLNFICDEALGTDKLRSYIEDENEKFANEKKEAKSKLAAAMKKQKSLKQELQDEMARAVMPNGANLSIPEHDALLSKIKSEAAKAHAELCEAKGIVPKPNQKSDAMRIEPEFLDSSGQTFWKLKSYDGECVLLQDCTINVEDGAATDEKWLVYGPEQKDGIDKYISSRRAKRSKICKVPLMLPNESSEENP